MGGHDERWVPNLVRGISIWNLSRDLNEPSLFDGRLLEPDVEGPDSLPDLVEWDLTGLIPLAEARAKDAVKVELALDAFRVCLRGTERWLETDGARFADAFTLPPLDGDAYFFKPRDGRIYVKNWGARPHRAGVGGVHVRGPRQLADELEASPPVASDKRRSFPLMLGVLGSLGLLAGVVLLVVLLTGSREADVDPPEVEPPVAPPPIDQPHAQPPPPLPEPTQRIYFEVDQPTLGPSEYATLEQARVYLEAHPGVRRLRVEGHTDGRGELDHNASLGGARALTVLEWLIARGVGAERLEAVSCAERIPVATNQTEAGRQRNRRVELFVVDPPTERAPHPGCQSVSRESPTAAATSSR